MKLHKKFLSLGLMSTLLLSAVAVPTAEALDSAASVEFDAPSEPADILDPDNPDDENGATEDQLNEGNTSNEVGALTLDFVSNLNFGTHELSANPETYYAQNTTTPFAQVTDVRGTGEGWRLVASMSSFEQGEGETATNSLPGATITLENGSNVTSSTNLAATPETLSPIVLSSDNVVQDITTAEDNEGLGTWITRWTDSDAETDFNQSVSLDVPAAVATEGAHNSTITWTLYNAPTGSEVEPTTVVTP